MQTQLTQLKERIFDKSAADCREQRLKKANCSQQHCSTAGNQSQSDSGEKECRPPGPTV